MLRLERTAAPAMLSVRRAYGTYGKIADLGYFAGLDLDDPLEASPAEQRACTAGHDHRHRPAETLERGEGRGGRGGDGRAAMRRCPYEVPRRRQADQTASGAQRDSGAPDW